ncbi:MAG: hypothetical protein NVSMB33_10850 [Ktedonobacteraceae bacterium]
MSRIPPVEHIELPAIERATGGVGGEMAMLFQVMTHRPELARQSIQLLETAMRPGMVDARLKELLAVRVSQVNACFY